MSRPNGTSYPPGSGPQGQGSLPPQRAQTRPPAPAQEWRHPADVDPHMDGNQMGWPQQAPQGYQQPRLAQPYENDGRGLPQAQPPDLYPGQAAPHGGQYQPSLSSYQSGHGQPADNGYAAQPQWQQPDPRTQDPRTQDPRSHDPRGYDLADYATGMPQRVPAPPHYAAAPPQFEPQFAADPYAQQTSRQQQDAFHPVAQPGAAGARYQQPPYEPQFSNQGYADAPLVQQPSYLPAPAPYQVQAPALRGQDRPPHGDPGHAGAGLQASAQDPLDDYPEDEYDDEPKRGGRKLLVVGALVGAICVGGGLAYAFKAFGVGGKTPLIAKVDTPLSKPKANQVAQLPAGAKVAEKLPEIVPNQMVASQTNDVGGPRSVQTIAVGPPGSQPLPSPPQTATPMPGMVLQGFGGPQGGPQPVSPQTGTASPRPAALPVAPPAPLVAAPPKAAPPAKIAAAIPEAPKKPVPPAKAKSADAFSPAGPVGATGGVVAAPTVKAAGLGAGGVGSGYVAAILSTQKGRAEAMKSFADLQQKYSEVLGSKPAEVQERDLGETKGIWFRAVVGPPGSREAAAAVCKQLAAAGHAGCFATAY
jgi:SPOR domain